MSEYEFTGQQNEQLTTLAGSLRALLPALSVCVVLQLCAMALLFPARETGWSSVLGSLATLIAVVSAIFWVLIRRSAAHLQAIVKTSGSDMTHLMETLAKVRKSLLLGLAAAFALLFCLSSALIHAVVVFRIEQMA